MKRRTTLVALILFLSVFGLDIAAQDEQAIKVETNLVSLGISVRDRSGNYVTGLQKEHFRVYDNGKLKEVTLFSETEAPVSFGFVYDLHPTTSERTARVLGSIRAFTERIQEEDDFFTVVFNERGSLNLDFVPSVEQVERHLSLGERGEPNSLYDAIDLAAEKLLERENLKKTLIIISDGKDRDSHHSYSALSRRLKTLNLQIYAVILGDDTDWKYSDITLQRQPRSLDSDKTLDRAALDELAKTSGGRSQEPVADNLPALTDIYERIALEMRRQYSIGFYPDDPDGKWHKIEVRIDHPIGERRVSLTYRKGYQSKAVQ